MKRLIRTRRPKDWSDTAFPTPPTGKGISTPSPTPCSLISYGEGPPVLGFHLRALCTLRMLMLAPGINPGRAGQGGTGMAGLHQRAAESWKALATGQKTQPRREGRRGCRPGIRIPGQHLLPSSENSDCRRGHIIRPFWATLGRCTAQNILRPSLA